MPAVHRTDTPEARFILAELTPSDSLREGMPFERRRYAFADQLLERLPGSPNHIVRVAYRHSGTPTIAGVRLSP